MWNNFKTQSIQEFLKNACQLPPQKKEQRENHPDQSLVCNAQLTPDKISGTKSMAWHLLCVHQTVQRNDASSNQVTLCWFWGLGKMPKVSIITHPLYLPCLMINWFDQPRWHLLGTDHDMIFTLTSAEDSKLTHASLKRAFVWFIVDQEFAVTAVNGDRFCDLLGALKHQCGSNVVPMLIKSTCLCNAIIENYLAGCNQLAKPWIDVDHFWI